MITKKKSRKELQYLRDEALQSYLNRPDFQYDANGDALYRHYKDQYTQLGKTAMQDTMGQAAALTGGYGSSYAQNVGQQAYQNYLSKADDVIPELYQLAYDRYRDKGDRLYKTYQSWADMEQQAAQQEQWEREYELEERKRQDANRRFELEQEQENSQTQTGTYQPDHWAMIAHYQKLGQNNQSKETAEEPEYDNGNVSEGNVKTMQRVLGLEETGKWTDEDRTGAGGLSADDAWKDYQQGKLQNRKSIGLGDQGLANGNVKAMERMLGLKEDGYWSEEDKKAAGGLSETVAWEAYQRGLLQKHTLQVKRKEPSYGDIKSMERVLGLTEDGVWSEEDKKAAGGWSQDTAWEAYQRGLLQKYKSPGVGNMDIPTETSKTVEPIPKTTGDEYHFYLTNQEQLEDALIKCERELAQMENTFRIYKDLVTREIGKAEEPKLAQLRQQYSSLDDLKAAIEEKKKDLQTVEAAIALVKQEKGEAAWKGKYRGMTYSELQDAVRNLEDGAEKDWVIQYSLSTMTSQEMKTESAKVNWEYERLSALLDQYKMLTRFEQPAKGRAKIKQIAAVYGSVTDLEDKVAALRKQKYLLDNMVRFNHLSENEDFAQLSQVQDGGSWLYKMVNNPSAAGKFDFAASVGKYAGPLVGTASMVYDGLNYDNIQHMTNDERAIFNYVYAKEGENAAREYLKYLEYSLNERSMNKAMDWVSDRTQDVPVLSQTVASLLSTPLALMGGHGYVDALGQKISNAFTGDDKFVDFNRDALFFSRASDMIRNTAEQDIEETFGKKWGELYRLGMDVVDSKAVAALKKIHPALGLSLLGSSASTQAMLDAKHRGATDEQALKMGLFGGGFELLVDAVGVGKMLETNGGFLEKEIKKILGEKLGKEFSEDFGVMTDGEITEFANSLADYMIIATNSNYEQDIQRHLAENPTWSYEQAEKRALIDAALQIAEADVGKLSSRMFSAKKEKR